MAIALHVPTPASPAGFKTQSFAAKYNLGEPVAAVYMRIPAL